jgi:hypothetical protein
LQKGYLAELLGDEEEGDGYESLAGDELPEMDDFEGIRSSELPADVRRVLGIRQMLGSASIKKLARMRACTGADGRGRGRVPHAARLGRRRMKGESVMHKQAIWALAHPVFDPEKQIIPGHFWIPEPLITAGLTVNIGME